MSERAEFYTPEQARQLLTGFVEQAELSPVVEDYQELQERIGSEVGLALTSLIMQTGRPPRHHASTSLAVLENRDRFTMVQGVIGNHREDEEPTTVQLLAYRRGPLLRFRRTQWAHVGVEGMNNFSAADDGKDFYMPFTASDEYVGFFKDKVGTRQVHGTVKSETGLEIAGEAARESSDTLNGYLRVAASLTKSLVEVDVAV